MTVERWTDEMLDKLASSVSQNRDSVVDLRDSVVEVRDSGVDLRDSVVDLRDSGVELRASVAELRDSLIDVRDSVDGLRVTVQALLQVASQSQRDMELLKQRQTESDQRFNILLEEVRYLIRGNQGDSNNS